MKISEIVRILEIYGAFKVNHTGRSLGDHLLNTYEILVNMNAPESACIAGAFHSIYGTNVFKNRIVTYEDRNNIQSLITPEAENLVYIFSTTNRPRGFETGNIISSYTGEIIEIDSETLEMLRLVEIANLMEQKCSLLRFPNLYSLFKMRTNDVQRA